LDLSDIKIPLNLDNIVASCPFLEELNLVNIHSGFKGSLERLSNLRSLIISESGLESDVTRTFLLPVNSAVTLTAISLTYKWGEALSGNAYENFDLFNIFINLTSFHIEPLSERFCDLIIHAPNKLSRFSCVVGNDPSVSLDKLLNMLSACCIGHVEHLGLGLHRGLYEQNHQIVKVITNLCCVKQVDLAMPLDTALFQPFIWMEALLKLNWLTSETKFDVEIETTSDANLETEQNVFPEHLKAEFEKFNVIRQLKVNVVSEDDYDEDVGEHILGISNVPPWFIYTLYRSCL
jgi:hypothetical protein